MDDFTAEVTAWGLGSRDEILFVVVEVERVEASFPTEIYVIDKQTNINDNTDKYMIALGDSLPRAQFLNFPMIGLVA